jgi:hypothetical protein
MSTAFQAQGEAESLNVPDDIDGETKFAIIGAINDERHHICI